MNSQTTETWIDRNKRYLTAALSRVREALERHTDGLREGQAATPPTSMGGNDGGQMRDAEEDNASVPCAVESVCGLFDLTAFERDILLLCAGMELDSRFSGLCAAAHGDPRKNYPTFSLALAAFPDAHWSAITPNGPLRWWRLIETGARDLVTTSPLHIDEPVLHYLAGAPHRDERIASMVEMAPVFQDLMPSHRAISARAARAWSQTSGAAPLPVIQLCGEDGRTKRAIAAAACAAVGLRLCALSAQSLPIVPGELDELVRLWEREAALSAGALYIDCDETGPADAARIQAIDRMIERTRGVVAVGSRERRVISNRPNITFDVNRPAPGEQLIVWQTMLGAAADKLNGQVEALASQFSLNAEAIGSIAFEVFGRGGRRTKESGAGIGPETEGTEDLSAELWDACRVRTRPRLDSLAQRIEPAATCDDLVLPERQKEMLREIAIHARQRMKVYESWGFGAKGSRGLGISALFSGASGTGKTMAAEVLADELRLDLYRIDLSQVVSKYIGETEKNICRVFDAAEGGGAILLFDEADALFGKRSEVKDSHDRYANIEVSYLLQRMELYRGLAILTTNMKSALDTAFLRRIRFVVPFPFPDAAQRAEIWRRVFPKETPTKGLAVDKLSNLTVAGGNIRNIALHAAFLAADAGEPVRMAHLLHAARGEYNKLEKTLTESETGGWV